MMPAAADLLIVEGLEKSFTLHLHGGARLPVVAGVAFAVERGECVVLGGPSGAGKSSILKMAYGITGRTAAESCSPTAVDFSTLRRRARARLSTQGAGSWAT